LVRIQQIGLFILCIMGKITIEQAMSRLMPKQQNNVEGMR
jgi:hypothetical protein